MFDGEWESFTPFQQIAVRQCSPCGGSRTIHRVVKDRHTGEPKQWCCVRCYTYTPVILPFSATDPPDGKAQILAALETLAIYSPIFMTVDQKRLYAITRRYFMAGWSVKDILRAIDYRPDDSSHESPAINPRDPSDVILGRMQTRLREWVWRDRFEDDEGGDIMPGPHTSMRNAMLVRAEEQKVRAFSRAIEWTEQQEQAQAARRGGAPMFARLQVQMAVERAKELRRTGDQREAEALAELVAWTKGQPSEPVIEDSRLFERNHRRR